MRVGKRRRFALVLPRGVLVLGERTLVMGVVNVTPDSFSDGGLYLQPREAVRQALALQRAGADIIDIGAESTRPGSAGISATEELHRLLPILRGLRRRLEVPISVDTSKAEVAEAVLDAGADMLNDISGLRSDLALATVAHKASAPLLLMHIRGTPKTMQQMEPTKKIWPAVESGLRWSIKKALAAGLPRSQLIIDPGIGFGKTMQQNYELLRDLRRLEKFNLPLLVGTSRKSFIGTVLGEAAPAKRIWGTAATVTAAILNGAHIVRVHDVGEMAQVARVTDAILRG